jgi:hypothetical protein
MTVAVWAAKGGAGATVTVAGLAMTRPATGSPGTLLVDLAGDLPATLGLSDPDLGVTDWLGTPAAASLEALARLELETPTPSVRLIGLGATREWEPAAADTALAVWASDNRRVIVDVGCLDPRDTTPLAALRRQVATSAEQSLLVTRACYLALRRAVGAGVVPTGVILVREPGRSLDRHDIEQVIGAPVVACIDLDPALARAVDAGLLGRRPPRLLVRTLKAVA